MEDVERTLNERAMSVEQGRMIVCDRSECMRNDVALTTLGSCQVWRERG